MPTLGMQVEFHVQRERVPRRDFVLPNIPSGMLGTRKSPSPLEPVSGSFFYLRLFSCAQLSISVRVCARTVFFKKSRRSGVTLSHPSEDSVDL